MAYITGADTKIGLKVASTFGTATTCTTGDQLEVESLSQSTNPEELTAAPIGSGLTMANDSRQGAQDPKVTIEQIAKYNDPGVVATAVFQGNDTVTSLGSGGYIHSILNNENFNSKFVTAAFQLFSATSATNASAEFPSCAVNNLKFTVDGPPSYAKLAYELLANKREIASPTNTYAQLETVTAADSDRVIFDVASEFAINIQSGSTLSSPTDVRSILGAELVLDKTQSAAREARGSGATGNGQPIPTGAPPFSGTLTVRFKSLDDATFFTGAGAGSEYKAYLKIVGPLIGGSIYKTIQWFIPRMKVITDPEYNLTSAAVNPHSVTFKILVATSNPSGMISQYPYPCVINSRSTSHLA